jgi:hypothetical protein
MRTQTKRTALTSATGHRMGSALLRGVCAVLILMTGSCAMKEATMHAPRQQARIAVISGTTTEQVFACAERELRTLAAEDDNWLDEVTLRDASSSVLESGNYADENVSGFRVRLRHRADTNTIELELKGAGPYFVDLGVETATQTFRQRLERCLVGRV